MRKAEKTPEQTALLKVLEIAQCSIATPAHILAAATALDMEPWFVEGAYFDYLDACEEEASRA